MSLAANPNATYEVTLESDAAMPQAERPVFVVRHMTAMQWLDYCDFADNKPALEALDARGLIVNLFGLLAKRLCGWRNVRNPDDSGKPLAFDAARLASVLSIEDAWDLYYAIRQGARVTAQEKNASSPPSPSPTGSSVPPAGEASAAAAPASSVPSGSSAPLAAATAAPSATTEKSTSPSAPGPTPGPKS